MSKNEKLVFSICGIIFFQTKKIDELTEFYMNKVGCKLWLDQGGCKIFQFENMLFGFCQRENVDDQGMITFYYPSHEEVNQMYRQLKDIANAPQLRSKKELIRKFMENMRNDFTFFFVNIEHMILSY